MRYALLMCTDESAAIDAEERTRRAAALEVFTEQMTARGTLLASEQLHRTETAATVRCWDGGDVMISDGPLCASASANAFMVCESLPPIATCATYARP